MTDQEIEKTFPELMIENDPKTQIIYHSTREYQCLITDLLHIETLKEFQTNIEGQLDKVDKSEIDYAPLNKILVQANDNTCEIHLKLTKPSEPEFETTDYTSDSLARTKAYLNGLVVVIKALLDCYPTLRNHNMVNSQTHKQLHKEILTGVGDSLLNLLLAWQDMIPDLEQVNSILKVTNLIEKNDQLSLQRRSRQTLQNVYNKSKGDQGLTRQGSTSVWTINQKLLERLKTAFKQKQELSIVLAQQSYTKRQSEDLFQSLKNFVVQDIVDYSFYYKNKKNFHKELNENSQKEISIMKIESNHWNTEETLESINRFCLVLNVLELKYLILDTQVNPSQGETVGTETKVSKRQEKKNFVANHALIRKNKVELDLFFLNKNGDPFKNPINDRLTEAKFNIRLLAGDKCKWFKRNENQEELKSEIQTQFHARKLTLEEIKLFLS